MMMTWNEQSYRWMLDAGVYSGYHRELARHLLAHLEPTDELCDVGCGLGRLDFELAPHVAGIYAIDQSDYAIKVLQRDVESAGAANIRAHRGVAEELEGVYDVILLSLFGNPITPELLGHCRRKVIRIVGASTKSGLYPEKHRREVKNAVPVVKEELARLGE